MFQSCIRRSRSCLGINSRYLRVFYLVRQGKKLIIIFGRNKEDVIIISSYARVTEKDSARKFVTFGLVLGIWRSDTGMSWRYRNISSCSFGYNKYLRGRAQSNVVNFHFVSLVRLGVVRDISRSARVVYFMWGRKKYYYLLALRFVVTYLCPVRSRRRDCSKKVKDVWFVGLIYFLFGRVAS